MEFIVFQFKSEKLLMADAESESHIFYLILQKITKKMSFTLQAINLPKKTMFRISAKS